MLEVFRDRMLLTRLELGNVTAGMGRLHDMGECAASELLQMRGCPTLRYTVKPFSMSLSDNMNLAHVKQGECVENTYLLRMDTMCLTNG